MLVYPPKENDLQAVPDIGINQESGRSSWESSVEVTAEVTEEMSSPWKGKGVQSLGRRLQEHPRAGRETSGRQK